MVLTVKLPTGGTLKWTINRSGEKLEVAFSNDPAVLKRQCKIVQDYINGLKGTNKEKFDQLEELAKGCSSGANLCDNMQAHIFSTQIYPNANRR